MSGDIQQACELVVESLSGARRFNDRWAAGMALNMLGHIELAEQRVDDAEAMLVESSALLLAIGNPMYLSWCLEGMAGVQVSRGDYRQAAVLCAGRDAHLRRLESGLPALHPAGYQKTLAAISGELDDSEIALATEVAGRRTIEELIDDFQRHDRP
jgi:hypothetical protein